MPYNPDKLAAFLKKKNAGGTAASRTGGKGSVRRKHKAVRKNVAADDKRLKAQLNRLNVRDIPAIEEVNMFKEDGNVIHFVAPKVQASIPANTYVVTGASSEKKLQELLPGIISQLGSDNLEELKKIYATYADGADGEDENDVPELVEDFENVSNKANQESDEESDESDESDGPPDLVDN